MPRGTPKTVLGVELDVFRHEAFERDTKVINQIVDLFGFDYDVVNVGFYGWPDVFPKNMLHALLVCSPCVLEIEGHSNIAIHAERGNE
jgi:hypothetical protein